MSDTKKITISIISVLIYFIVVAYVFSDGSDSNYKREAGNVKLIQAEAINSLKSVLLRLEYFKTSAFYFEHYFDSLSTQQVTYSNHRYIENQFSKIEDFSTIHSRYKIEEIQNSFELDSTTSVLVYELIKISSEIKANLSFFYSGDIKQELKTLLDLQNQINNTKKITGIIKSEIISDGNKSSYEIIDYSTMKLAILTTELGKYSGPGYFEIDASFKDDLTTKLSNGFTTKLPVFIEIDLVKKNKNLRDIYKKFKVYHEKIVLINRNVGVFETRLKQVLSRLKKM